MDLAAAGQKVTAASQASLQSLATDVGLTTERQLVRDALVRCPALARQPAGDCVPPVIDADVQASDDEDRRLARLLLQRVRAAGALHDAYGALAAEAGYNARSDLDGSLDKLFASVNTLTKAVAAAAPPATVAASLAEPLVRLGAGEAADASQTKRLLAANAGIGRAATKLADALAGEAAIYASVQAALAEHKAQVARTLFEAGIADPTPLLSEFNRGLSLGTPEHLNSPQARVSAETLILYRAIALQRTSGEVYAANQAALRDLAGKHGALAAGRRPDLSSLTYSIEQLSEWATVLRGLAAAAGSDTSPAGGK